MFLQGAFSSCIPFDGMLNFDVDTSFTYLCLIQVNVFLSVGIVHEMKTNGPNGLFTFTDVDSDSDPDSNPVSLVDNWDWNLKQTLYNVKSFA